MAPQEKRRNPKFEWQTAFIASGLTGNTGFIGLLMSTFDNGDGRGFFLSGNRISSMTNLNEDTVRKAIKKLCRTGWLNRTAQGGNRGGVARASSYALTIPEATQPDDASSQPGGTSSQPDASTPPLDQVLRDQNSRDQNSRDQVSRDQVSRDQVSSGQVSSGQVVLVQGTVATALGQGAPEVSRLTPGDELSKDQVLRLTPELQFLFYPSFEKPRVMVYDPTLQTISTPEPHQSEARPTQRELRIQRDSMEREMREEGLDINGMPLSAHRPTRSRYA